jgi:hypothetical protein
MSIKDGKHNRNKDAECQNRWLHDLKPILVDRTIKAIRYLTDAEVDQLGWMRSAIVLELDDGTAIWPSADDEGNDAGALFTTNESMPTIPVI